MTSVSTPKGHRIPIPPPTSTTRKRPLDSELRSALLARLVHEGAVRSLQSTLDSCTNKTSHPKEEPWRTRIEQRVIQLLQREENQRARRHEARTERLDNNNNNDNDEGDVIWPDREEELITGLSPPPSNKRKRRRRSSGLYALSPEDIEEIILHEALKDTFRSWKSDDDHDEKENRDENGKEEAIDVRLPADAIEKARDIVTNALKDAVRLQDP